MVSTFRQNLRNELDFQGLTVKELSARTGIPKSTLDCYLGSRATMPPADAAVLIAKSLHVTVEYLVTGTETPPGNNVPQEQSKMLREIMAALFKLNRPALCYAHASIQAVLKTQDALLSQP